MQELTIQYKTNGGHGTMRLNLDNCFPCSLAWLRKLLKVVDMSEKSEELRADLVIYLNERLDEVADGQTVGVPQDASNQSRAFLMLEQAGWLKLKGDANKSTLTTNDVAENPHNLQIKPMDSATIPRSLDDLDWGVIPGSISYSSGVDTNLQLFQETLRPELILQAVTTEDKKDSEWAKAVVEAYKSDEFHSFLDTENENGYWFVPDSIK